MNAIEIRNMYKDFKLVYDKPTTLKERICSYRIINKITKF